LGRREKSFRSEKFLLSNFLLLFSKHISKKKISIESWKSRGTKKNENFYHMRMRTIFNIIQWNKKHCLWMHI
jgi:hypothetical protein